MLRSPSSLQMSMPFQQSSSKQLASKGTRLTEEETKLLLAIWEEEFNGFTDKKRIKAEDWEKLTAEYNEQAAENNFVQRTSTQCQNRILNLKDMYKKMKDQQGKSGESYRADKENNDFPYFEIMDRVLCDKQSFNPQYIYDPGRFKLKEKSNKLSDKCASLSDE